MADQESRHSDTGPDHADTNSSDITPSIIPPSMTGPVSGRLNNFDPERSTRVLLLTVRLLFMVFLLAMTLIPFVGSLEVREDGTIPVTDYLAPLIVTASIGVIVLLVDAATPRKRLSSVFGIYLGIVAGLGASLFVAQLVDIVAGYWSLNTPQTAAYLTMIKLGLGIIFCYLAVSIVLTTKDDFRLVIPYVEFSKQVRGVRPLVLDTSSLIDGRIEPMGQTGFLDAPLILPQFVIDELQRLADSGDRMKRERGRRGLSVVSRLQQNPHVDMTIDTREVSGGSVDHMLLQLASEYQYRILTTDYNLNKVAEIRNVPALNLHDVANTLKAQAIPGDHLSVEVIRKGESPAQGVGYMPDGTMIVIEGAAEHVGKTVSCTVTNSLQTGAGRMIFGKIDRNGVIEESTSESTETARRIADAATSQPRATGTPPARSGTRPSTRNPRRSS